MEEKRKKKEEERMTRPKRKESKPTGLTSAKK
jgi:hypothetical protein